MSIWNEGAYDTEQLLVLQGAYDEALTLLNPAEHVIGENHHKLAKFIMGLAGSGHRNPRYLAHTSIALLRNDTGDWQRDHDSAIGTNSTAPAK